MYTLPLIVLAFILIGFLATSLPFARSAWKTFSTGTAKGKTLAIANFVVLLMLLLSVAVQYNDPDWFPWMMIYGYASVVTWFAVGRKYSVLAPIGLVGYVLYALYWMPNEMVEHPSNLLLDMRMHEKGVEEVREDMGLWICAAWMLVLTFAWWFSRRERTVVSPGMDAARESATERTA